MTAAPTFEAGGAEMLRVAVAGCGDVARRWYASALADLRPRAEIVACCDAQLERAEQMAAELAGSANPIRTFATLDELLDGPPVDALLNLTPAPNHAAVTEVALSGGLHVYSEKPLAGSVEEADRLIALARAKRRLLMCAPAVAVAPLVRWLLAVGDSGRLGAPTLCTGFVGDLGPAAWREYTGDPGVFYGREVGPLVDIGVYALHAFLELFGPIRRVQAMGGTALPRRVVRAGAHAGRVVEVEAPDQLLVNLDFGDGRLGRLIASYTVPASRMPWLEVHFSNGTISVPGTADKVRGPVDVFVDDPSPLALSGWIDGLEPPMEEFAPSVIPVGARHFVAALRGEARPELTAEKARHVLEVCLLAARSREDGRAYDTTTRP